VSDVVVVVVVAVVFVVVVVVVVVNAVPATHPPADMYPPPEIHPQLLRTHTLNTPTKPVGHTHVVAAVILPIGFTARIAITAVKLKKQLAFTEHAPGCVAGATHGSA
jgi:hypothetical protein